MLEGDLALFFEIDDYVKSLQTSDYHNQMMHSQKLKAADHAWEKQDYEEFLKQLDILNVGTLPGSYKLKQNIAIKKLNK